MGSLLLLKLQSSTALDMKNEIIHLLYLEHVTHSDSKLAAYYFLHALLTHAADTISSALAPLPRYSDSVDPVKFAAAILAYRQGQLSMDRKYTTCELSLHFLRELDSHSFPVQVHLKALKDLAPDDQVPPSLLVTNLALVLSQSPSFHHDTPLIPFAHRFQHHPSRPPSSGPPTSSTSRPPHHPFRQREELQCDACGTWGHSATRCSTLAKHYLVHQYISSHQDHADWAAASTWKELHSTTHRRAAMHIFYITFNLIYQSLILISHWTMPFTKRSFSKPVILPSPE